ncbi:MAG TPA: hypothetical protein QF695_08545 [Arenicellales bacterium]|nr:hypothetical protein [Arenicellales bacterium]
MSADKRHAHATIDGGIKLVMRFQVAPPYYADIVCRCGSGAGERGVLSLLGGIGG